MEQAKQTIIEAFRSRKETRIAIQKDGRLSTLAWKLLEACMSAAGIPMPVEADPEKRGRKLIVSPVGRSDIKILLVRQGDIPWFVMNGHADFGIAGEDRVLEEGAEEFVAARLGGATCSLVLATRDPAITSPKDLAGKIIATTYPRMVTEYCEKIGVRPRGIVVLEGSVEIAPLLDIADVIADISESGKTLKEQGLTPFATIRTFEAVLIAKQSDNASGAAFPSPITAGDATGASDTQLVWNR